MKTLAFLFVATMSALTINSAQGQERARVVLKEKRWNGGSITLTDGRVLNGQLRYNESTGFLSFRHENDTVVLTSNTARSFSLRDTIPNREFISLEYVTEEHNGKRTSFFEKVKEYTDFAILLRTEPYIAYRGEALDIANGRHTQVYEVFTFYLVKKDGTIVPFIRQLSGYQTSVKSSRNARTNMNFYFEKGVLENQIGKDKYKALTEYAQEKDLSFRIKSDFLGILKQYDQIRGTNQ
jgi:hypothetical protein